MDGRLVFRDRVTYGEDEFAEFVIWEVPAPVPPSRHAFKYRFVDGVRVIGFDNERGKGDHRHDGLIETPYRFEGIDRLMNDFVKAIENWRASYGKG